MSSEYKNNHYVPQWYQKLFIPNDCEVKSLFYLSLKPSYLIDKRGVSHRLPDMHHWGPKKCFCEDDLYVMMFGTERKTKLESQFFGMIDSWGRKAVEYFSNFNHQSADDVEYRNLLAYMGAQKLRTPKGLNWISKQVRTESKLRILNEMVKIRMLYGAIWTESIWQIADASDSPTKFIISDHPVTVYNRSCGPKNQKWCRGSSDPDIALNGTHTIFPLSLDKVLILTNLSWVRNPYQSALRLRPNPRPFRPSIGKFQDIQIERKLTEKEVREINFVIKSRAYQYVAAAKEEWLFPEEHVSKSDWNRFGDGYLFMPDPRALNYGGQVIIGHADGTADAFDEYGRRPWEEGYTDSPTGADYDNKLFRFQGEFARLYGPKRRGRSFNFMQLDNEIDDEESHGSHLAQE